MLAGCNNRSQAGFAVHVHRFWQPLFTVRVLALQYAGRAVSTCVEGGLQRAAAHAEDEAPSSDCAKQLCNLLRRLLLRHDCSSAATPPAEQPCAPKHASLCGCHRAGRHRRMRCIKSRQLKACIRLRQLRLYSGRL